MQKHVDSWYAATANLQLEFAPLRGAAEADVCVIGGGYTGLSTAIHLRQRGYSVILLEANRIGWGASGRNGGHVGADQRLDQQTLEKWLGRERAHALWDLALEAVDTVAGLVRDTVSTATCARATCTWPPNLRMPPLREEVEHLQRLRLRPDALHRQARAGEMTSGQGFHGGC